MFSRLHMAGYNGWALNPKQRKELLRLYPPAYNNVVADHITFKHGVGPNDPLPGARKAQVVGVADDGEGTQALVVSVNGREIRPDGGVYHITWSLAPGRKPASSNNVLFSGNWKKVTPYSLNITPRYFK